MLIDSQCFEMEAHYIITSTNGLLVMNKERRFQIQTKEKRFYIPFDISFSHAASLYRNVGVCRP